MGLTPAWEFSIFSQNLSYFFFCLMGVVTVQLVPTIHHSFPHSMTWIRCLFSVKKAVAFLALSILEYGCGSLSVTIRKRVVSNWGGYRLIISYKVLNYQPELFSLLRKFLMEMLKKVNNNCLYILS